jgi:hypothetical protein
MKNYNFFVLIIICLIFQNSIFFSCNNFKKTTNKNYEVAKIDEKNNRIFVVVNDDLIKEIKAIQIIVFDIFNAYKEKYNFKERHFNISFFSDAKYAGYKTDPKILNYVKSGEWGKNYLAEYSSETNELWTYPLQNNKKKCYEIILYKKPED